MIYVLYMGDELAGYCSEEPPVGSYSKVLKYETLEQAKYSLPDLAAMVDGHNESCKSKQIDSAFPVQMAHACKATEYLMFSAGLIRKEDCAFISEYATAAGLTFTNALGNIEREYKTAAKTEAARTQLKES